jgi:hypothetical protein
VATVNEPHEMLYEIILQKFQEIVYETFLHLQASCGQNFHIDICALKFLSFVVNNVYFVLVLGYKLRI